MIKIENVDVYGFETAIRGMRNPKNSWNKSDSTLCKGREFDDCFGGFKCQRKDEHDFRDDIYCIGCKDHELMMTLRNAGTDHRKFMRFITVTADITAPLYYLKEFDTYKVGTVANSCSTMHKIADKEFELSDFSVEHLSEGENGNIKLMEHIITRLNAARDEYNRLAKRLADDTALTKDERKHLSAKKKFMWWQMIQLLPTSYNQKRTVLLNYEVLANMYKSRKGHKLDEWNDFCSWIESLPYSELITGDKSENG